MLTLPGSLFKRPSHSKLLIQQRSGGQKKPIGSRAGCIDAERTAHKPKMYTTTMNRGNQVLSPASGLRKKVMRTDQSHGSTGKFGRSCCLGPASPPSQICIKFCQPVTQCVIQHCFGPQFATCHKISAHTVQQGMQYVHQAPCDR
jgi:hypothetical protein